MGTTLKRESIYHNMCSNVMENCLSKALIFIIFKLFLFLIILFLKNILFIYFLERGEEREKERERNINVWLPLMCPLLGTWPATQAYALTGNQSSDP